jgi:hypothetical protein
LFLKKFNPPSEKGKTKMGPLALEEGDERSQASLSPYILKIEYVVFG